jgi:peroxidase
VQAGGPSYAVELGRFDGLTSTAASVNGKLPAPTFSLDQLNTLFASNGLSQNDMVALSGMATLHMSFSSFICFQRRLESPSSTCLDGPNTCPNK